MYKSENKSDAIKEVQKYLITINDKNSKIVANGIYDFATKNAIEEFQTFMNIPVTGTVDYKTFTALYETYKRELEKKRVKQEHAQIKFPIKLGDYGTEVLKINEQMGYFLEKNEDAFYLRGGSVFSKESAKAARRIREILRLKEGSDVDEEFYHRIENDNNLRFLFEQK